MYINYFNAVGDSLDLAAMPILPDTDCQPIGSDYTNPPQDQPYGLPHCPPCACAEGENKLPKIKPWNIFWLVVGISTVLSFVMGGEDKSLTGSPLQ